MYERFDPDYLADCARATDAIVAELQDHTRRTLDARKLRANPAASRPVPGFRPTCKILKLHGKMVGATGIEPVTPTMSTDAEMAKPLRNLADSDCVQQKTTGTPREQEQFHAQAARKERAASTGELVVTAEITANCAEWDEAKYLQDLLRALLGQVPGASALRITVSMAREPDAEKGG